MFVCLCVCMWSHRTGQLTADLRPPGEGESDIPVELETLLDKLQGGQSLRAGRVRGKRRRSLFHLRKPQLQLIAQTHTHKHTQQLQPGDSGLMIMYESLERKVCVRVCVFHKPNACCSHVFTHHLLLATTNTSTSICCFF